MNELSRMCEQIQEIRDRYREQDFWEAIDNRHADEKTLLDSWTWDQKMALLKFMLKPGTKITIQLTEGWLHTLLLYNPGVLAEAERLKERLPAIPWHAKRAAAEGETYWLRLASSYQGN